MKSFYAAAVMPSTLWANLRCALPPCSATPPTVGRLTSDAFNRSLRTRLDPTTEPPTRPLRPFSSSPVSSHLHLTQTSPLKTTYGVSMTPHHSSLPMPLLASSISATLLTAYPEAGTQSTPPTSPAAALNYYMYSPASLSISRQRPLQSSNSGSLLSPLTLADNNP